MSKIFFPFPCSKKRRDEYACCHIKSSLLMHSKHILQSSEFSQEFFSLRLFLLEAQDETMNGEISIHATMSMSSFCRSPIQSKISLYLCKNSQLDLKITYHLNYLNSSVLNLLLFIHGFYNSHI